MNFKEELNLKTQEIEQLIRRYLPKEEGFASTLARAMNYSMLAGGKRLRPLMMQEVYRMFGGTQRVIEPFMVAMEMIHTHSLIHDDLPALDNDEYRRGRETTWKVFGEDMGVISGAALLNYAYEVALSGFELTDRTERVVLALRRKPECMGCWEGRVWTWKMTENLWIFSSWIIFMRTKHRR